MSYAIVTDSASSFTLELARKLDVTVLPLNYYIDEVEHRGFLEDAPVDLVHFYRSMRAGAKVRTSLPDLALCQEKLTGLLNEGKDILYLGFSRALSGTFDAVELLCQQLREEFPQRTISCIETVAASFGEGLLVRQAALKAKAGATLEEVANWIEGNRQKAVTFMTVDDLSYVLGGGRLGSLGGLAASAANALKLKPILCINDEGAIGIAGKARGRKKSLVELFNHARELCSAKPEYPEMVIAHADCEDDAQYLAMLFETQTEYNKPEIEYLDPVIGTHGGPGSIAVFFLGEHR